MRPGSAPTTTTITSVNPSPSYAGARVVIAVSVSSPAGAPSGAVVIGDGSQSCTTDTVNLRCSLTFNTTGTRTLTATYAGNQNFLPSNSAGRTHDVIARPATANVDGSGEAVCRLAVVNGQPDLTVVRVDVDRREAGARSCLARRFRAANPRERSEIIGPRLVGAIQRRFE